jgi:uracil-DNA glycosylase family 4
MSGYFAESLQQVSEQVVRCTMCPRLVSYIQEVGEHKVRRFINEEYWSRPVSALGDKNAPLVIVGLAPAAHGGNRTGRMFTGDSSGQWLMKALFEIGYANIPQSISKNDGLILRNVYITSVIKCAPPLNKPVPAEIKNCSRFLQTELDLLEKNIQVIIALGRIAFESLCRLYGLKKLKFQHGACFEFENKYLIASYHPSKQNTNTGKLRWDVWMEVFYKARSLINSSD